MDKMVKDGQSMKDDLLLKRAQYLDHQHKMAKVNFIFGTVTNQQICMFRI